MGAEADKFPSLEGTKPPASHAKLRRGATGLTLIYLKPSGCRRICCGAECRPQGAIDLDQGFCRRAIG
jgi:hypothetical protein